MPKTKIWNTYDKVLQSLYGIDLATIENPETCQPIFGSGVRLLLSTAHMHNDVCIEKHGSKVFIKGKNEELLEPTYTNLAYHFGMLDWAERNVNYIVRKSNNRINESDLDKEFMRSARVVTGEKFHAKYVLPLRRELEKHGLYFYCLPSVSLELDETSGAPLVARGDDVLCLLPMTPAWARVYGLSEDDIRALAPQVLWLIKNLCSQKIITSREKLEERLDGWHYYVSLPVRMQIRALIAEKREDLAEEA